MASGNPIMSTQNYESWIWTELLAFDNTQSDQGVQSYCDRLGFVPNGISLLLSAVDFIMLHESMDRERTLFPDVCARCGHGGNEERRRQGWTNWQLRSLVRNLQAHKIEVFFSVFMYYLQDKHHHEWASDHRDVLLTYDKFGVTNGVNPLARMNDGTLYEDVFVPQLVKVIQDYGFDGWHGPDGLGPSGGISMGDCSDSTMAHFAEYLGEQCPEDFEWVGDGQIPSLRKRMDYIWNNLWREWTDFNASRWESFWRTVVNALRPLGKKTMINSGNTKSAFESLYNFGIDYRNIAEIGVDYLVVETVAGNLALINGDEPHFEFAATLAEMKAFVPNMKVIFLHGIKDVVESYDLLRHAPARLEREVFTFANQYYCHVGNQLARCADGFLACLGDGLKAAEWEYLHKQWDMSYDFRTLQTGSLTWVFDPTTVDALRDDYQLYGTWPGFKQVAYLTQHYDLQTNRICNASNIDDHHQPLIVPNFDLCSDQAKRKLFAYKDAPVVLLGKVDGLKIPETAYSVLCPISKEYTLGCVILNSCLEPKKAIISCPLDSEFVCVRPPVRYREFTKYMKIPDEFWKHAADAVKRCVNAWEDENGVRSCRVDNVAEGLRVMTMCDASGRMRTAFVSCAPKYICPEYRLNGKLTEVTKRSGFPYTSVDIVDGVIVTGWRQSVLRIPPYGIIVMDMKLD